MRPNAAGRLTLAALLCALTAVLAQIQIPLPPVPVNLALIGVHLCGCLLGARTGAAAMAAYAVLGLAGMPVLAGFAGGPSVVFGPTGGFIAGYILAAWLEGQIVRRGHFSARLIFVSMAAGTAVCYALGTLWFMVSSGTAFISALSICVLPFLPGDLAKIVLAMRLCIRLQKPLEAMGMRFLSP